MTEQQTVLVTGITGFIALHCADQALAAGYRVRGSLRSPAREQEVRDTLAKDDDRNARLSFVTADLLKEDGWADAVAGCDYVLHVASPFPANVPKDENELIVPAREGTLRVLHAAAKAGVNRVVLTSSIAAVAYGHDRNGKVFDEDDWTNTNGADCGAYEKSKTLAERAAWDFVASKEAGGMELAVINPGAVFGPLMNKDFGTSAEIIRKFMARELPAIPRLGIPAVDVRDVASAHLAAMTHPEAAGKRFCCVAASPWMSEIGDILSRKFKGRGFKVPTGKMPDWMFKLASLFDRTLKLAVHMLGTNTIVSNERLTQTLNWQPRSVEEMVVATADSLIEFGILKPKS